MTKQINQHKAGVFPFCLSEANISEYADKLHIPREAVNVTNYPDFDEFVLVSDCLITDDSSTIIEAGVAGKMGFFFAVDIEAFKVERDLYIPLEGWPFPLSTSNEELADAIDAFDWKK